MSKVIDSVSEFIRKILSVAFWCFFIYLAYTAWNSDWNFDQIFYKSVKRQEWLDVERVGGKCSKEFVSEWARSIMKNTELKIKIREPVKKENAGKIDLVCTVKTELTKVELVNPEKYDEVTYCLFFELKFIDEDGFILRTLPSWWCESTYKHEKYSATIREFWHKNDEGSIFLTALIEGCVGEEVIKKTAKVVYEPSIEIYSSKLKEEPDYSEFGFIPENEKAKTVEIEGKPQRYRFVDDDTQRAPQKRPSLEEIFSMTPS